MYYVGIDLGGTNIAVGVVNENYQIVSSAKRKTNMPRPADEIADDMSGAVKDALDSAGISISDVYSVGVGTPGAVNPETGIILTANNLKFDHLPLGKMMEERLGKKVYIENDANAAAYGEFLAGAGKGARDFIAVTLGTGVGGGVIIGGKMLSGSTYAGGEIGHSVIMMNGEQCSCGRKGCFEAYASATALVRQTKAAMEENKDSLMWELCEGKLENASPRTAFDAMRKNDAAATEVVEKYEEYIAEGVTNLVNIFQPEIICIGGGISGEKEALTGPIRRMVSEKCYTHASGLPTEIVTATLGNDAGIIGAAYLCKLYE